MRGVDAHGVDQAASFEPLARDVMLVDSGGLATRDPTKFEFKKLRRPVWPLDDV